MRLLIVVATFLVLSVGALAASQDSLRSDVAIHDVLVVELEEESKGARIYQIKPGAIGRGIVLILEKEQIQGMIVPAGFPLTVAVDRGTAVDPRTTILLYHPGASVGDARLIDSLIIRPSGALEFTSDEEHATFFRRQHETEEAIHGAFRQAFRELYEEGKE